MAQTILELALLKAHNSSQRTDILRRYRETENDRRVREMRQAGEPGMLLKATAAQPVTEVPRPQPSPKGNGVRVVRKGVR